MRYFGEGRESRTHRIKHAIGSGGKEGKGEGRHCCVQLQGGQGEIGANGRIDGNFDFQCRALTVFSVFGGMLCHWLQQIVDV
mgnify:CR=1 FL=1